MERREGKEENQEKEEILINSRFYFGQKEPQTSLSPYPFDIKYLGANP